MSHLAIERFVSAALLYSHRGEAQWIEPDVCYFQHARLTAADPPATVVVTFGDRGVGTIIVVPSDAEPKLKSYKFTLTVQEDLSSSYYDCEAGGAARCLHIDGDNKCTVCGVTQ